MKDAKNINKENKTTFKKIKQILNYIGKIISYACIVILVLIGIFLVYYMSTIQKAKNDPNFKPVVSLYTIISGSMEPTIHVYDVVLNKAVNSPEDIKVGDVITFISTSSISEGLTVTHRVQDIKIVNGEYEFVTKGDYNPTADSSTAKYYNIIGKVVFKIPQLGRVQFFVASKAGWFFVVLLPAMGVIIYDVLKLFKLLGAKTTSDKIKNKSKKKNIDINVDKAIDNIKKNDYNGDSLEDLKDDILKDNKNDNSNLNKEEDKNNNEVNITKEEDKNNNEVNITKEEDNNNEVNITKEEDNNNEVNITKEDYLNRLNALKNRNKN